MIVRRKKNLSNKNLKTMKFIIYSLSQRPFGPSNILTIPKDIIGIKQLYRQDY